MLRFLFNAAQALASKLGYHRDWYLVTLAVAIGSITALGAIGFVELLYLAKHAVTDLLGHSPHSLLLPLFPMAGALLTGLLVYFFAREAKGHGVPEVMDAILRKGGRVRPRVALVKSLASVCTIGSGGSAGAEGPIVQIGSAIGSGVAQLLRVSREQTTTLLGCGAAAGIASVFNAPIAGVFFVLEILLRDFSLRTFMPIVVASVFSAAVTQAILGENEAIFAIQHSEAYEFSFPEIPSYIVLGLICGVVAVGFVRALYYSEDLAERVRIHPIIKPVVGALLLGLLGVAFLAWPGSAHANAGGLPWFFGNGYEAIRALIDPATYTMAAGAGSPAANEIIDVGSSASPVSMTFVLLVIILLAKILATCFTLGSGGSGGVFAPSLFMGATAGAATGVMLDAMGLLVDNGSPAAYALVGMAAVVAATTHAPLTAMLILLEITRDIYVLLPIMLAAVVSTSVAQLFLRDSVYSLKLRRRGINLGSAADWTLLRRITASEVPLVPHVAVLPHDPVMKLVQLADQYSVEDFVVVDEHGRYAGLVPGRDLRTALIQQEALPLLVVEELLRQDLPTIDPDETLDMVMDKFASEDVSSLAVVSGAGKGRVLGVMTRQRLMRRYNRALAER